MSEEKICFCYITCPDPEVAEKIAKIAITANKAACANIIPGVISIYQWEGAIQTSSEVVLILKTTSTHVITLQELIILNHPYDCPCFVTLSVVSGHQPFLNWVVENTKF